MNNIEKNNIVGLSDYNINQDSTFLNNASKAFIASNASPLSHKVLIITYYWPPSGGAGVQRWLKFSKYLPQFGWEPVILTVDPEFASYPAIDHSLEVEIPAELNVHKTKATDWFRIYGKSRVPSAGFAKNSDNTFSGKVSRFIRGNFFIPDPRRGWNKFAFREACKIIEKENIRHIITTSPPHSTQLIGLKLKKTFPSIKWIADMRDPWTDIYYYRKFYPSLIALNLDKHYERSVLIKSDEIITVGKTLKNSFSLAGKIPGNKITVITNGFDESDYSQVTPFHPAVFTITYVGTISESYPIDGLIEALRDLHEKKPDFIIRFTGEFSSNIKNLITAAIPASCVEFTQYLEHNQAIQSIMNSSVVVLIIPDHKSNKGILTGKLFEYLAAGVPVLCLGPVDGDAAEIISRAKAGATFGYNDIKGISGFLSSVPGNIFTPDEEYIKGFSRVDLTRSIIPLLEKQ
jgi:glycosyltransferase involved in cell wall biosynthesis